MEKERLIRKLNSVGKEMFVRYYRLFEDYSNQRISRDQATQRLVDDGVSNEAGASIRIGNAKAIFIEKGNCQALSIILNSKGASDKVVKLANEILREDCS